MIGVSKVVLGCVFDANNDLFDLGQPIVMKVIHQAVLLVLDLRGYRSVFAGDHEFTVIEM